MELTLKIDAKLKAICEERAFRSGFRVKTVALTDTIIDRKGIQREQLLAVDLMNDDCDLVDDSCLGADVVATVRVDSREWVSPRGEVKYFTGAKAIQFEVVKHQKGIDSQKSVLEEPHDSSTSDELGSNDIEDMPF